MTRIWRRFGRTRAENQVAPDDENGRLLARLHMADRRVLHRTQNKITRAAQKE
jgi:hypothetical protein